MSKMGQHIVELMDKGIDVLELNRIRDEEFFGIRAEDEGSYIEEFYKLDSSEE